VLAKDAEAGAWRWRRENGVQLFVDKLLSIASLGNPGTVVKPAPQSVGNVVVSKILDRLVHRLIY
jgi:hypothetical protein